MTKDEALDLALEALENCYAYLHEDEDIPVAITAIKQARSAPVQEPVHQWRQKHSPYWYDGYPDNDDGGGPYEARILYTTPHAAQRQWTGLTDEEIEKVWQRTQANDFHDCVQPFARAIEAKLKERNV